MSNINYDLLDTVHKFIKANPEAHRQETYVTGEIDINSPDQYDVNVCGTAACVAGWASVFDGWVQVKGMFSNSVEKNGVITQMHFAGRESLGLTPDQAEVLFSGGNGMEHIDAIIEMLHDNPDATYLELEAVSGDAEDD